MTIKTSAAVVAVLCAVLMPCRAEAQATVETFASGVLTPKFLAFDSAGNLYVSGTNIVSKVTPDGSVSTFATGFTTPYGLAFDNAGTLYVADAGNNTVSKVMPDGSVSFFVAVIQPIGLAFDGAGNLYAANFGTGAVSKVTPGGVVSTFASGLSEPFGLAFDGSGNLYVSNFTGASVSSIAPNGTVSPFASGLNEPAGLAFDGLGNLYVAKFGENTVSKVSPDGATVTTFIASGLTGPEGLAFDSGGVLYIVDSGSHTIERTTTSVYPTFDGTSVGGCPVGSGWSVLECWNGGAGPVPSDGDIVILNATTTAADTYDITRTLRSITVNNTGQPVALTRTGGATLGLSSGGSIISNNAADVQINTGVTLNGPTTFTLSSGASTLSFNTNAITGTGPLTLVSDAADDNFTVAVANDYTGATTVNGTGEVRVDVNGGIPTCGALTVNGKLRFAASSSVGSLAGAGLVALGANTLTVGCDNTDTTFSGVISGTGGLTKTGTGTLTLSGTNTATGPLTINAGTVLISGTWAGPVIVGAGTTLSITGTVTGPITNNGGTVTRPLNSATFNATGALQTFTVPAGVSSIVIDAKGAEGGRATSTGAGVGGKGAEVAVTVPVTAGEVFCIVAGKVGGNGTLSGSGGGGSFVYRITSGTCASNLAGVTTANLIVAAGGGGGGGLRSPNVGGPGRATGLAAGAAGAIGGGDGTNSGGGTGGTGGNGGTAGTGGGGGGGLLTDGGTSSVPCAGGKALINGADGAGSCVSGTIRPGGFGGGGAAGGGGGYNGGGGAADNPAGAGGGGSYAVTAPDVAVDGARSGDGQVVMDGSFRANHFAVVVPSSAAPGTAFSVTVVAIASDDTTDTSYSGTVHITASDGLALLPADATLTNGIGTFSVALHTGGSWTITATDTLSASITGTSAAIAVADAPTVTSLTVTSPTVLSGTAQTFAATVTTNGVAVTGGSVTFTDTTTSTTLASSIAVNGSGQASTTSTLAVGGHVIDATYTPDAGHLGSSGTAPAVVITSKLAGGLLYVPNAASNNVSVYTTGTDGTLTSAGPPIAVGSLPLNAAVRRDQAYAYVSNAADHSISVIDTSSQLVTQTLSISGATFTFGIAINPAGSRLYVAARGATDTIRVLSADVSTGQLTETGSIPVGNGPNGVAISPDGTRLYVVNENGNSVSVVDTATETVIGTVPVGSQPVTVALNPAGTRAYVTNLGSNSVSVINTATNAVVATPGTAPAPYGVAVTPDGGAFYVSSSVSGTVSAFNASTNATIESVVTAGSNPIGLSISADGAFLYTANAGSDSVGSYALDSATGIFAANAPATIAAGTDPFNTAMCRDGNSMLVSGATFQANTAGAITCAGSSPTFTGGTLLINSASQTISQAFTLGSGGGTINTSGNAAFTGGFTGSGALTKTGDARLLLSGSNSYLGATVVSAGTLRAGAAGAFSSTSGITVAGGATLDLDSFPQTVGSIGGAGTILLGSATLTAGDTSTTTFSGGISGSGGLTKTGTGTLLLTGINGYTGPTTVSGGTLGGTGTIAGTVTVTSGTVLAPGTSPGTLHTGSLSLAIGATLAIELNGPAQYDQVDVTGAVDLGSAMLALSSGVIPGAGQVFTIVNNDGTDTITGAFVGFGEDAILTVGGTQLRISYHGGTGNDVTLTVLAAPTLTGTASPGVAYGGSVSETATLAGGFSASGTITFTLYGPNDATCAGAPAFTSTVGVSGNGSYGSGPAALLNAGTYRWIASYSGDLGNIATSTACANPNGSVTISKADQTITFDALANRVIDNSPFQVSAAATSTLPVAFESTTTAVCTMSGSTVTLLSPGTCTITASQGGNGNYNAAAPIPRSFSVLANCANVTIQPGQLAAALAGTAYSQTFTIAGGASPATFTLTGALPGGLTFSNGIISGTPAGKGIFPFTVTATDANACQASASYSLPVSPERRLITGMGGAGSTVRAITPAGVVATELNAYGGFSGGASVAQGDVNGDGVPDIITGAGPAGGPHVKVFDGHTGATLASFFAFAPDFISGIEVAAGDITGDGIAEVIVAGGCGAPVGARAFNGLTGALVAAYTASTPSWSCGLHVAAGDVNGDGLADIVLGSGGGGGDPFVVVLDGVTGATIREFLAYGAGFGGGVYVAAGDLTGDGRADIVTGAGPGGGPHVRAFDGVTLAQIAGPLGSFFAYPAAFAGGVRVAAGDLDGDGIADLVTGAGVGGGPHVRVFNGATAAEMLGLFAFDPAMTGGVFVAAPPQMARMSIDLLAPGVSSPTSLRIAGWAFKQFGIDTTGTDAIHAWAYPVAGGPPVFVGAAPDRVARPDVANFFGGEFLMAGFDFTGTLAPGTYDLVVFARNGRTLVFDQARMVRITIP